MTRIGKLLKLHRAVTEQEQKDLAAEIGIGASTLCRIEKGKSCSMEAAGRLINWLLENPND